MRGFCLLLAVFATLYQLASAQSSAIQRRRLIAEQEDIACTLKEDDLLRTQFEYIVRALHGVQPNFTRSTFITPGLVNYNTDISCRAGWQCSEDAEVVWCLHMYHPSEDIELCWNFSSGEISMTDYARQLGINEILYRETTSPQDLSLWVRGSPYFLSNSFLACTVRSQTCSAISFHRFQVKILDPVIELSNVSVHNSSGLLLGQTLNVFLCIAEFQNTERFPIDASCDWSISGGMENITYADLQGCDPLQDSFDCFVDYESRIRFYQMRYNIRDCPLRTFLIYSWLVIENATEADAELLYSCQAHFTATNPLPHFVSKTVNHSLTPIYPSLEIISLETPSLQPGAMSSSPYLLKSDEMLQWDCSVLAGEGDSLVWLLNGTVIPDIDNTQQDLSCSLDPSSEVFSVSHETLELGEFQRQFTSTLMLCRATERTVGTYQCAVNRTRGDVVSITEIWSASVQSSPEITTKINNIKIIVIVCAVCASTLLILIIAAILICCCLRYVMRQRERRKSDWTKDIFVMDDILHITGASETDKSAKNQALFQTTVDPLEFPRNKLVFLNTILGKGTFGVVLQAKAEDIVKSAPHRNIVAVKTTREKAPPHEINNFWEELQLMKQMIPHGNVINLLGHCTTPGGPIYMIIEYARYGSLKDFLKECEQVVLQLNHVPQVFSYRSHQNSPCSTCSAYPQLVDKTQLTNSYSANGSVFSPDSTSTPSTATTTTGMFQFPPTKQSKMTRERLTTQDSGFGDYSPQAAFSDALADESFSAHTVAPLTHNYINSKGLLYMEDVQNFALQIACGLKHLEESQIVHCDLAARNILIAEGFVLKIGDFGMARDVSEKEYYRKQGGRIPVKWTAPEALTDHIFTFKSDIWSFGVVLWEVLTYGQQPYPKLKIRHSWEPFINYLMEGNRLSQPKGCPDSIYDLMQSCWHSSPEKRPTADELVHILSQKNLLPLKKTIAAETSI